MGALEDGSRRTVGSLAQALCQIPLQAQGQTPQEKETDVPPQEVAVVEQVLEDQAQEVVVALEQEPSSEVVEVEESLAQEACPLEGTAQEENALVPAKEEMALVERGLEEQASESVGPLEEALQQPLEAVPNALEQIPQQAQAPLCEACQALRLAVSRRMVVSQVAYCTHESVGEVEEIPPGQAPALARA